MSNTAVMRDLLIHELGVGVRTTQALVKKVPDEHWGYRPCENMRTLLELANHLTQIPFTDLAILQEKSQAEVQQLEGQLTSSNPSELSANLQRGYETLSGNMKGLSEAEFVEKVSKAYYAEQGSTQAQWLVEIVTHLFHHRAQFFTYLKQLGVGVNMYDLY